MNKIGNGQTIVEQELCASRRSRRKHHLEALESSRRELKARVAELLPFVEHIAGATCRCQQDRIQAEQNYHMPSCMVGQAQQALAGRKEG